MSVAIDAAAYLRAKYNPTTFGVHVLLYFAQGWSLAWRGQPLFEDAIEAWVDGPVVETVWTAFHWGDFHETLVGDPNRLSAEQVELLDVVGDFYTRLSPEELTTLARRDPSWAAARADVALDTLEPVVVDLARVRAHFDSGVRVGCAPNTLPEPYMRGCQWTVTLSDFEIAEIRQSLRQPMEAERT